jgi:hypothetical protein
MLEFKGKCVIDIDLARSNINPREWALLKGKVLKTCLLYTDREIFENAIRMRLH